jgi:hypothetical protein
MSDDHTALLLERLRLAASLVHALPQLGLELGVDHGPHVLVSHNAALQPDVTPCEFRRMVAHLLDNNPLLVGFGWIREIRTIEIGGVGATCTDGIVSVVATGDAARVTAFVTDLDTPMVMASARQVAEELIERDPCAIVSLRQVQLRVDRDEVLGVSVVTLPWHDAVTDDDGDDEAVFITAAIAERCAVDAFLAATSSRRV